MSLRAYHLTREQLLADLHQAYYDARRHKRQKPYQQRFERNAEANLAALCDELWERRYEPQPSTCFIINEPKRREVFAANFRDRVVHHLYFNYTHEMLERTFISDTYSCIRHRGTHYGIDRLEHHIRQESQNYQERCYVLKMDISGYFMHIDRRRLLDIALHSLRRMASHSVGAGPVPARTAARRYGPAGEHTPLPAFGLAQGLPLKWRDVVDMDFVAWLSRVIILQDSTLCSRRRGTLLDWYGLPHDKSLFHSPPGCGLPIGNLTSQLFSNVYLNELDQYVKRQLGCHHYGRYVDDFYIVSADREWLLSLRKPIATFLSGQLGLEVNAGKTVVYDVRYGVEFLGAWLKPGRRYVSRRSLERMASKVPSLAGKESSELLRSSLNSFLGVLSHYKSYRIRRILFTNLDHVYRYGYYLKGMSKFVFYPFQEKNDTFARI
ncbi:MAG: hypothetical protein IJT98_07010 [Prevotella sp.]|nr:hypothetical protein [Prevotella sp.]